MLIHCHTPENAVHSCIMKSWTSFAYMHRTDEWFGSAFFIVIIYISTLLNCCCNHFIQALSLLGLHLNLQLCIVHIVYCFYKYIPKLSSEINASIYPQASTRLEQNLLYQLDGELYWYQVTSAIMHWLVFASPDRLDIDIHNEPWSLGSWLGN